MAAVLGLNAKAYHNTGSYGTPVWDLIGNIKNLTLNMEKGEADVTTRANNGWKAMIGTLKDASVDFEMVWDTADTDFTAIQSAFLNNTDIEFLILDGLVATAGSQGLRATMTVSGFTRNEQLEEALTVAVKIRPTYATNAPSWWTTP